ncbi:hypothetical protein ACFE04_012949 [Oxalis oulophora]
MASSETKKALVKVKPNEVGPSRTSKFDSSKKVKIETSSTTTTKVQSSSGHDSKPKSASTVTKITEVKTKTTPSSSKTVVKTATKVRQKKVYTLPGQKHDPPEEREPLRIFYESLSKQIPTSEMAHFWLMEHGLLPADKAKRAFERKQAKQKQIRMGTPVKPQKSYSKPESSHKPVAVKQQPSKNGETKAVKRIKNESDDDDDFILSHKRRKG